MGRFAISLVPFAILVFVTAGFLFLPKPGAMSWVVLAAVAVSVPILIWDGVQDVKELGRTDPEFGTGRHGPQLLVGRRRRRPSSWASSGRRMSQPRRRAT